ncbi:MAG: hypothetical protein JST00_31020 [Deltaproteobacteria bacterium]|nr:hypothetical protein [Deltaproteobacteria bacterium]
MPSFLVTAALVTIAVLVAAVVVVRMRRRKRLEKPAREASAFVILEGNAWDACNVDDVREPWSRLATEPIRGFCGVPSGRHRVRTTTSAGEATLDFVIYPGEVLSWRLDPERARWEPHDLDAESRATLEAAPASTTDLASASRPKIPGWLVHLRTTIGMASQRGSGPLPRGSAGDDAIERVRKRLAKLVARAEHEPMDNLGDLLVEARGLGEAIIGKHLTRRELRTLVGPAREAANRLSTRGDSERAMNVVGVGLAVLPGDPELMVAAGCALAARGESDEAMRALEAALERDRCLEAEDVARAMRARMELRSRLGRSVRVS